MKKTLLCALGALLILPSAASAATVTGDVTVRNGLELGPVTFKAAKGEVNDVTITNDRGRLRFRDAANRLRARGDCDQVNRHTAACPITEEDAKVFLGNKGDRASVAVERVRVLGGGGNDVLRGSTGANILDGQRGHDTLHGGERNDDLTGGPGRDRVYGGSGDDELFDGETDAQAAKDLFRGGSSVDTRRPMDRGDTIDYSKRKRGLDIDLSRGKAFFGREGDVVRGFESVRAGSGSDKLSGDGDENAIEGRGGNDTIRGRGGDDFVAGNSGNDRVSGEDGNDYVNGDSGTDRLFGGAGDDQVTANDSNAETVDCGDGTADWAVVTRIDTVQNCEVGSNASTLAVRVNPELRGNRAIFGVACLRESGCTGDTLRLSSTTGEDYGSGPITNLPHGADVFNPVEVDLTQAGREALRNGATVVLTYGTGDGGFRAFMRAG